ncbi:aminotransferase class V-fold PLP-dependent enzyme [Pelagibacterium sp.]|uniref:aminotransferase class V-fold PLP-dependent enzyme n=1 Tax=Pelagibacterium sp. TaxID=1967288 RepID=UPI003A8FB031
MTIDPQAPAFEPFYSMLEGENLLDRLAAGLIGKDTIIEGPFGPKALIYADYVASGRALMQIERFMIEHVLPFYANSHTQASYCGAAMTLMREQARGIIARSCGAGAEHAVIFAGGGATAGINRLVSLFGLTDAVAKGQPVRVLVGPYEHHSNILPWRESGAEFIEIPEDELGGPCQQRLKEELAAAPKDCKLVCSFSAASNVTGITSDVATLTRIAKAAGALVIWDYAGGAPYLPIAATPEPDCAIDAIVLSPHKFIGGPGATGVLIVRRDAVTATRPTWPGGGTVRFVTPESHDYSDSLEAREEAGTPNVVGDIRAALAFIVKDAIGATDMAARNAVLAARARTKWSGHEAIELLGAPSPDRLPIFSFRIRDGAGGYVHQQLVTRLLSDVFGIQARGGCACAGPYVHRLLAIEPKASARLRAAILAGEEVEKPGFTRLNFSVLMDDETVDYIIDAVLDLAVRAPRLAAHYDLDPARAIFTPKARDDNNHSDAGSEAVA